MGNKSDTLNSVHDKIGNTIQLHNVDVNPEYRLQNYHNVSKENRGIGKDILENETILNFEVDYKKKRVKVHLSFSEETDKTAQSFYDGLKKIYIQKSEIGALKTQ